MKIEKISFESCIKKTKAQNMTATLQKKYDEHKNSSCDKTKKTRLLHCEKKRNAVIKNAITT